MIRALIIIAAAIVVVIVIVAAFALIAFSLFSMSVMFGPGFDDFGENHECVGCRGWELKECRGCRYNPEYWDGMTYKGPSRRELRRLRKEKTT